MLVMLDEYDKLNTLFFFSFKASTSTKDSTWGWLWWWEVANRGGAWFRIGLKNIIILLYRIRWVYFKFSLSHSGSASLPPSYLRWLGGTQKSKAVQHNSCSTALHWWGPIRLKQHYCMLSAVVDSSVNQL